MVWGRFEEGSPFVPLGEAPFPESQVAQARPKLRGPLLRGPSELVGPSCVPSCLPLLAVAALDF